MSRGRDAGVVCLALAAVLAAALALGAGGVAVAADPRRRVVLLRPAASDEITVEALARIRGELTAALFEVVMMPQDPALDPRTAVQTLGKELDPIATFAIVLGPAGAADPSVAEVWIYERVDQKTAVQRMPVRRDDPARGAAVLAVQAVELLKAALAEFWTPPAPSGNTPAPAQASGGQPAQPQPPTPEPSLSAELAAVKESAPPGPPPPYLVTGPAVEAGLAWLQSFRAVGAVWQPMLRISFARGDGLGGRVTFSGFGTRADLQSAAGLARVDQKAALLEVVKIFRRPQRLQLVAGLGAGVGAVQVDGTGIAPYTDGSGTVWSLLTCAGAGAMLAVHPRLGFTAGALAWLSWPHAVIRIGPVDAGRTGWPSLMLHAGIVGTL